MYNVDGHDESGWEIEFSVSILIGKKLTKRKKNEMLRNLNWA